MKLNDFSVCCCRVGHKGCLNLDMYGSEVLSIDQSQMVSIVFIKSSNQPQNNLRLT